MSLPHRGTSPHSPHSGESAHSAQASETSLYGPHDGPHVSDMNDIPKRTKEPKKKYKKKNTFEVMGIER